MRKVTICFFIIWTLGGFFENLNKESTHYFSIKLKTAYAQAETIEFFGEDKNISNSDVIECNNSDYNKEYEWDYKWEIPENNFPPPNENPDAPIPPNNTPPNKNPEDISPPPFDNNPPDNRPPDNRPPDNTPPNRNPDDTSPPPFDNSPPDSRLPTTPPKDNLPPPSDSRPPNDDTFKFSRSLLMEHIDNSTNTSECVISNDKWNYNWGPEWDSEWNDSWNNYDDNITPELIIDTSDNNSNGISDKLEINELLDLNSDNIDDNNQDKINSLKSLLNSNDILGIETSSGIVIQTQIQYDKNISNSNYIPSNLKFSDGVFVFVIAGLADKEEIEVTFYLSKTFKTTDKWFINSAYYGWQNYTDNIIGGIGSKIITVTYVDGFAGDNDENPNGAVFSIAGPAYMEQVKNLNSKSQDIKPNDQNKNSTEQSRNNCFISTISN